MIFKCFQSVYLLSKWKYFSFSFCLECPSSSFFLEPSIPLFLETHAGWTEENTITASAFWVHRFYHQVCVCVDGGGVEGMLSISGRTITVGKAQVLSDGPFCPAAAFLCLQVCKGHSPVDSVAESQKSGFRLFKLCPSPFCRKASGHGKLSAHHVACRHVPDSS